MSDTEEMIYVPVADLRALLRPQFVSGSTRHLAERRLAKLLDNHTAIKKGRRSHEPGQ